MGSLPICDLTLKCNKPHPLRHPSEPTTLGEHIRKTRTDAGIKQSEAAAAIGVTESTVWNWEVGGFEPEIRHWPAIFAFLGRDPRPKPTTLGESLIHYRTGKGWARPVLAKLLNVDPSTLARWERGKKAPLGPHMARVAELLSKSQHCG